MTLTIAFAIACHKYYFDFIPNVIVIRRERFSRKFDKFSLASSLHKISSSLASSGAFGGASKNTIVFANMLQYTCYNLLPLFTKME
jgi:hypothetical protein